MGVTAVTVLTLISKAVPVVVGGFVTKRSSPAAKPNPASDIATESKYPTLLKLNWNPPPDPTPSKVESKLRTSVNKYGPPEVEIFVTELILVSLD